MNAKAAILQSIKTAAPVTIECDVEGQVLVPFVMGADTIEREGTTTTFRGRQAVGRVRGNYTVIVTNCPSSQG